MCWLTKNPLLVGKQVAVEGQYAGGVAGFSGPLCKLVPGPQSRGVVVTAYVLTYLAAVAVAVLDRDARLRADARAVLDRYPPCPAATARRLVPPQVPGHGPGFPRLRGAWSDHGHAVSPEMAAHSSRVSVMARRVCCSVMVSR